MHWTHTNVQLSLTQQMRTSKPVFNYSATDQPTDFPYKQAHPFHKMSIHKLTKLLELSARQVLNGEALHLKHRPKVHQILSMDGVVD